MTSSKTEVGKTICDLHDLHDSKISPFTRMTTQGVIKYHMNSTLLRGIIRKPCQIASMLNHARSTLPRCGVGARSRRLDNLTAKTGEFPAPLRGLLSGLSDKHDDRFAYTMADRHHFIYSVFTVCER